MDASAAVGKGEYVGMATSKTPGIGAGSGDFSIDELLVDAAYPHPVAHLKLKQTHVSWVVLTGRFAYKIKKPVRYDFIDASTLERRRSLCEEELRLNRRFAPDLYVDVVPITRRDRPLTGVGDPDCAGRRNTPRHEYLCRAARRLASSGRRGIGTRPVWDL